MPERMALALSLILLLLLGACAAPGTPPVANTPTPAPGAADQPPPASPPPSTAVPAMPTPTPVTETAPAGAAGEQAVVALALDFAAKALGVGPDSLQWVSIEAVQWPDSCLGVSITDQACAEVITPGYRVVLDSGGARYAVHTNQDGSSARFAGPTEPSGQPAAGLTPAPWDPAEIYATVIRQVVTVDHTFGQPPDFPIVYLVRQTSGNVAMPGSAAGSETIFPGDQQRILALLDDLPSEFVWVDQLEDVPRGEHERVAGNSAAVQVGVIAPQDDGSLQVPGSIFVAPLAAGGQTYVLQFVDERWTITGKSGPTWMS